jgi:hypothetical protein
VLDEGNAEPALFAERNFFGVLRVTKDPTGRFIQLAHGSTIHGKQSLAAADRREPLAYFDRTGPLGDVFDAFRAEQARQTSDVAIVGLGAGAIACYARPEERWTFYEIDPAVVRVARDPAYFTFLSDAFPDPSRLRVAVGDARLEIGRAAHGEFGLIVLDAFSGDTIPMHLVTVDAMRVYADKLGSDGLLAFNLSNRYVDLRTELEALARESGFVAIGRDDLHTPAPDLAKRGKLPSRWVAMARTERPLTHLKAVGWTELPSRGTPAWTDDRSNLTGAFMR